MGILSRLLGDGGNAKGDTDKPEESVPEERSVQGVKIPINRETGEFSFAVHNRRPAGLLVRMEDFVLTQGELLSSDQQSFRINADKGPCRLVCAGCDTVFSEQFVFACGSNSAAAAFGMQPHTECPDCGSSEAIIAFLPD